MRSPASEMSEDKKPFTVSDRRHFTAEGDARQPEAAEDSSRAEVPPPSPPRVEDAVPRQPETASHRADPGMDQPRSDVQRADEDEEALPPFPTDFMSLLGSLATQATLLLMGDPRGGSVPGPQELDAVRSIVALLESLQGKTQGNRTEEEDRFLEGALYQLRMGYVARTRAAGA